MEAGKEECEWFFGFLVFGLVRSDVELGFDLDYDGLCNGETVSDFGYCMLLCDEKSPFEGLYVAVQILVYNICN